MSAIDEVIELLSRRNFPLGIASGEWSYINQYHKIEYIELLQNKNYEGLRQKLNNLFDDSISFGLITPVTENLESKEHGNSFLQDLATFKDLNSNLSLEDLRCKFVPRHRYSTFTEPFSCFPDSPRHAHTALNLITLANNFGFGLEIGGGYGGQAFYLKKFGFLGKVLICDLLETLIAAFVFLRSQDLSVALCFDREEFLKEFEKSTEIILFTPNLLMDLSRIQNVAFVSNSRSLSEMSKIHAFEYLNLINDKLKPPIFFSENAEILAFPNSERHIEIVQQDLQKQLSNYRLYSNSPSLFSGGNWRYSERIYVLKGKV
jgi:hypothetical protein